MEIAKDASVCTQWISIHKVNQWASIPLPMYHTMILFDARSVSSSAEDLDLVLCELERNGIHLSRALPLEERYDAVEENSLGYCKYRWLTNDESDDYYHLFFVSANLNGVKDVASFVGTVAHELEHVIQRLIEKQQLDGEESPAYMIEYLLRAIFNDRFHRVGIDIAHPKTNYDGNSN